ncbi:MAG TPA: ATP-binding protein [Acidobacteriaceae bacterium]|nr:ATP-binding protein [Acidobacteriaceae bacterium]
MPLLRPRTIRGQLMTGLIIFEILVLAVVSVVLIREQRRELQYRTDRRLEYQASLLAIQSSAAFADQQYSTLDRVVQAANDSPSIHAVQITDLQGRTLFSSDPSMKGKLTLSPRERIYLRDLSKPVIFSSTPSSREAVAPVRVGGTMKALVWLYPDDTQDKMQLRRLLTVTLLSAIFGVAGCTIFASLMARSIAKPIGILMRATRQLIRDPEDTSSFPLAITSANEASDLTTAFNLMVASIQEQRAGLNDTLALLDSMLANAPIGFAFFDRRLRFVRVNQFMAGMNNLPVARHLGHTVNEVFSGDAARVLARSIESVFEAGQTVQNLELTGDPIAESGAARSWLTNLYPVRTGTQTVRWAGMILVETTERRRAEDALRRTEKLAAAGRLAASIAHEINNPLEAITNLLYLIRQAPLDPTTAEYADLAAHEITRVSEITQQTLRFYRQSTLPLMSNVSELVESVLALHHGRITAMQLEVVRHYAHDVQLHCFAGEIRQLLANLIGNAIDAMTPLGGRLSLRVRYAHSPSNPEQKGVRITVADTGIGMSREVQRHIFEPFFTTKESTGTGLGLWVSAEIVGKHQGLIRLRSCERIDDNPSGTVFSVFFPSAMQTPAV